MEELNRKLSEILEEDILDDTDLRKCENMDSLSMITIVSMVDEDYDVQLTTKELRSVSTPLSLMELIKAKK